jgi:hypothetical protein
MRVELDEGRHMSQDTASPYPSNSVIFNGSAESQAQYVQRTSQLLLDIWREACRHIEIDEFLRTVSPSLVRHAPIEQVIVRRFDRETSSLITVAAAPPPAGEQALGERHDYAPADFKQLLRWGASDRIVTRGKRLTGILGLLVPEGIETDVIAVPLSRETEASGALLLIGRISSWPKNSGSPSRSPSKMTAEFMKWRHCAMRRSPIAVPSSGAWAARRSSKTLSASGRACARSWTALDW